MSKDYVVFSQRLAGALMVEGFVLKNMKKTTKDNSNRNVFFFKETRSLLEFIDKFN